MTDHVQSLLATALHALGAPSSDTRAWWVPGRIEVLGKHTDYAGGPSLLCAVERGFVVVARPRADRHVTVVDAMASERADGEMNPALLVRRDHWSNYPLTVCRRIARNFPGALRGADLAFASDLPAAAGLSSSSAFIVGAFFAIADVNALAARPEYRANIDGMEGLAGYLGAIENGGGFRDLAGDRGVGTEGGSEDHTAILLARPNALVQYAFAPIRFEREVSLPNEYVFLIASSGVVAAKTGDALELYNRAARRARDALALWQQATQSKATTLAEALAEDPTAIDRFRAVLADRGDLLDRVEQFHAECDIVRAAGDALSRRDLNQAGTLIDRSQEIAERLLENQVPETVALAHQARELGAAASSAFGAGFGGSVYALVRAEGAPDFLRRWRERYAATFPARRETATFFVTAAGRSAAPL